MLTEKKKVLEQYQNSNNLEARIALHKRFSTARHDYHRWLFDQIKAPAQAKVLELGTGSAKLWQANGERLSQDWEITLSGISMGMLEDAKKNLRNISGNFLFTQIDAQLIPFDDATFDVVIANHMLYHVLDVNQAIAEVRRVLKPDGYVYAATGGLTHMKELDDFVREHIASKLTGVFDGMDTITRQFALENGGERLARQFANVKVHLPPESHLQVTEAQPLIDYILSMARWSKLIKGTPKSLVDSVVNDAKIIAERRLPIHISTSAGLFEAW